MHARHSQTSVQTWPHHELHHVICSVTETTTLTYTWTCPDCNTLNNTQRTWPKKRLIVWPEVHLETRCGHCHGTHYKLADADWHPYLDPKALER